jgi:hypothetical protein
MGWCIFKRRDSVMMDFWEVYTEKALADSEAKRLNEL